MPKIVDHEEQRRRIIEAAWRVIVRQGISNTTTREIAKEARCSSGVLAHYFSDKAEIMNYAMRAAHEEVTKRVADTKLTGMAALREYMLECLPLDTRRKQLAAIEASFWGQAVGNDKLIKANGEETEKFYRRLRLRLEEAENAAELKPDVSIETVLRELRVLMDGLSVQSVLYAGAPSKGEQIAMLDAVLERILA